jgi:ribosomal protein S18 acetylase RimI-like enzyme
MLMIRSFHNEDPPRLLELWKKSRRYDEQPVLIPLSLNVLQAQVLGLPLLDFRSIILAFDGEIPVGYVHTTFAPLADGSGFDQTTGHICFLCVDPMYHDTIGAAKTLIKAGEQYLKGQGAEEVFGGSPRPGAPFYTGFYSGGEAIGILGSDAVIVRAFLESGYQIHRRTIWFHRDLRNYEPPLSPNSVAWHSQLTLELNEIPKAKTWWEACLLANGDWLEATAYLNQTMRPIARARIRIACPDTDEARTMYGGTWSASLMDIRVHPEFYRKGVAAYTLRELLRHLAAQNQIVEIDSHVAEDSVAFYALLRTQIWEERDIGYIFFKPFAGE